MIERLLDLLELPVGEAFARLLRWLRRPRFKKRGALAPVIVTKDGAVVSSIKQVPLRSRRADAKRRALAWARIHWNDPTLTWGQARKRLRKLEAQTRGATKLMLDGKDAAVAIEAAMSSDEAKRLGLKPAVEAARE